MSGLGPYWVRKVPETGEAGSEEPECWRPRLPRARLLWWEAKWDTVQAPWT